MKIRKTKKEDLLKLSEIFRIETSKKPYRYNFTKKETLDKIKDSLKKKDVYTLEINNNPEGFFICELRPKKKQIYLDELWISKENQGRGYGKQIMKFIEMKYKSRGYKEITLVADKNANASKFYKKLGYKIKHEWFHMGKKLR
jgi:ribosomal protein S18 acetylase RimI-like enzyme